MVWCWAAVDNVLLDRDLRAEYDRALTTRDMTGRRRFESKPAPAPYWTHFEDEEIAEFNRLARLAKEKTQRGMAFVVGALDVKD